ncbi:uncharacterized protein LOC120077252 [Benincasa hispida]|uniref:uncharacterized protein LOC120077252 n=1 Tax=Benincasa hispida TaxID=102211 RepID=UPI0018FFFF66|nr:uncharacterized protein LOC120077252 [Benincasa hispida]
MWDPQQSVSVSYTHLDVYKRQTLGFLAFAVAAVVEWPVGVLVYCFRHHKGRRIMGHPATVVYPSVSNAVPI